MAGRLEIVENNLATLTADGDGRLATIERSVSDLTQSFQQSQDSDVKYRRLRGKVTESCKL